MTTAPKVSQKVRVQLDLSENEVGTMNWLMDTCDLSTRKDLFNNAVTLFEWAVEQVALGRRIISEDSNAKERLILTMPALKAASQKVPQAAE